VFTDLSWFSAKSGYLEKMHDLPEASPSKSCSDQRPAVGEIESVLLIRFKSIGDILFTLPAVSVVRDNFPKARITYLTSKENVSLIAGFREVDEVIGIDRSVFRRPNLKAMFGEAISVLRRLRQKRFSLAVDFQGYGETAFMTWLSGAKNRWGSVYHRGRAWAYTRPVTREQRLHPADWNLSLLRQCGLQCGPVRNEFVVPDEPGEEARQFFVSHGLDPAGTTLFIQPFTSSPNKNWPLENYLVLAANFRDRGVQVVFGGGPADHAALAPARAGGFVVSAGAPLIVTAGLIKYCDLIVGGDTGLLHLAVAMNKRVVMLMRSAAKNRCHPFQHPDWVLYPPDDQNICGIKPQTVIDFCSRALAGKLEAAGAPR
jgi:ADP-heptose:LPS heptosyltransferase